MHQSFRAVSSELTLLLLQRNDGSEGTYSGNTDSTSHNAARNGRLLGGRSGE